MPAFLPFSTARKLAGGLPNGNHRAQADGPATQGWVDIDDSQRQNYSDAVVVGLVTLRCVFRGMVLYAFLTGQKPAPGALSSH